MSKNKRKWSVTEKHAFQILHELAEIIFTTFPKKIKVTKLYKFNGPINNFFMYYFKSAIDKRNELYERGTYAGTFKMWLINTALFPVVAISATVQLALITTSLAIQLTCFIGKKLFIALGLPIAYLLTPALRVYNNWDEAKPSIRLIENTTPRKPSRCDYAERELLNRALKRTGKACLSLIK